LGMGDWGLGPIPNPQSPIPNPQSPTNINKGMSTLNLIYYILLNFTKMKNINFYTYLQYLSTDRASCKQSF